MPSTCPEQYMDAADIRMLRDILRRSGYRLAEGEAHATPARADAMFVISQFRAGKVEPSFLLRNPAHEMPHARPAADDAGLQAWENEGGATPGDARWPSA